MNDHTFFKNKAILITGGTGSLGKTLAKKLLDEDECSKVIIFSRDEWKQSEMLELDPVFKSAKIRYFLGDVRDKERLERAFNEVNYVIHAAALKQVPAAEYNPTEFIKTNVIGAMNIIDASINCGVEKVIALSTDKAANRLIFMGQANFVPTNFLLPEIPMSEQSGSLHFRLYVMAMLQEVVEVSFPFGKNY